MIGLIEFARKKGSKDKQKRKRRYITTRTNAGLILGGMGASELGYRVNRSVPYQQNPKLAKRVARSLALGGFAASMGGAYLQARRYNNLRNEGYDVDRFTVKPRLTVERK